MDRVLAGRMRRFYGVAGALFLVLGPLMIPLVLVLEGVKMLAPGAAVCLLLLGCGLWASAYARSVAERMILEGNRLRIIWPYGRSESFALDEVMAGRRGLLAGRRWVAFCAKFRGRPCEPLYDQVALGAFLLRVPTAGAAACFLEGLRRGAPLFLGQALMWIGAIAAIAARIAMFSH